MIIDIGDNNKKKHNLLEELYADRFWCAADATLRCHDAELLHVTPLLSDQKSVNIGSVQTHLFRDVGILLGHFLSWAGFVVGGDFAALLFILTLELCGVFGIAANLVYRIDA